MELSPMRNLQPSSVGKDPLENSIEIKSKRGLKLLIPWKIKWKLSPGNDLNSSPVGEGSTEKLNKNSVYERT